ncbi:hypothetical protein [Cumulibacter soli]|uniref:hypothetical protein n=1 Tax=Cumulibacter soli TaxID=2546344 RepID=UPI001067A2D4|nr:hypothetical protein [Cumulibacter soli]
MTTADDEHTEADMRPMPSDVEPAWYGAYIRQPHTNMSGKHRQLLMFLALVLAGIAFLILGSGSIAITAVIASALGLTFGGLAYATSGGKRVGLSIGPDTVSFGRDGEMHHWRRSALRSVQINDTYRGGPVSPAIGTYLVQGYRYLTLHRVDGVVAHVSLDSANPYADIIEAALVEGAPLPELSHPPAPSAKFRNTSTWHSAGADASVEPMPSNPPVPPTISAKPDATGAPTADGSPGAHSGRAAAGVHTGNTTGMSGQARPEPEEILWRRARERHDAVLLAYSPYEVDPGMVMRFPAMTDVTIPATAEFIEALSDASAFRTDEFPDGKLSAAYRDSISALEMAWSAAERHARSVGTSLLADTDRRRLDQAYKLLKHAEGASTDAERATYFQQVKTLMDDLARSGAIMTPPKVRQAISTKVRLAVAAANDA